MAGKVYNSFADAAKAMGIRVKKHEPPTFTYKCAQCGGQMVKVADNVAVCRNPAKDKDGNELPFECGRSRVFPTGRE